MSDQAAALAEMREFLRSFRDAAKDNPEFAALWDERQIGIADSLIETDDHDPVEGAKAFLYFHKKIVNEPEVAAYFDPEQIERIKAVATEIPIPPAEDA